MPRSENWINVEAHICSLRRAADLIALGHEVIVDRTGVAYFEMNHGFTRVYPQLGDQSKLPAWV